MTTKINDIVSEYAAAHIAAEPNARIMCGNPSAADMDACTERMRRIAGADAALMALVGEDGLSPLVRAFLDASGDAGCPSCWVSSRRSKNHPECNRKIDRFFAARTALIEYGRGLNVQPDLILCSNE